MIEYLPDFEKYDFESIAEFAGKSCLGVKALGPLKAYGAGFDFLSVWVQKKTGITALITKFYGDVTVVTKNAPDNSFDEAELEAFLKVTGYSSLLCDFKPGSRHIMKLSRGGDCKALPVTNCNCIENSGYRDFYGIITKCHDSMKHVDFDSFYVDMNHRIRHGTAGIFLLENEGVYVSAVAVVSVTKDSIFLSSVSTLQNFRGRHFASTLIFDICEKYGDKTVYLICAGDKVPFYEKAGFVCDGSVYMSD